MIHFINLTLEEWSLILAIIGIILATIYFLIGHKKKKHKGKSWMMLHFDENNNILDMETSGIENAKLSKNKNKLIISWGKKK